MYMSPKYQACSGSKLFATGGIPEKKIKSGLLKKSAGNKKETQITQNSKTKKIKK